ncbi:SGNH/GDSL hydrolase family protein [Dethiosulfatarculus sandiegensis]|uniref:SGNH hydrolase-type esterase domain-containing protein n=1 Tax=Dethiosulfatarculus sandiegensis TaxID=1429043 RepID=A0A0D2HK33_9BACT|nr:SGNH/GDSL hydrolase family protein [Dethiosulfatarculus sandiegensis]KIX10993.1 hypothetical protein X474_26920 [Dethiosulfatarculus sandiegensis]
MNIGPWLGYGALAALPVLEAGSRLWHRLYYGLTFRSRVIGEYPYTGFMEKAPDPFYFTLKPNFSSPQVHINSLGIRGPEPLPLGKSKRIMLMGESEFFGAKLPLEKDLWSIRLKQMLDEKGLSDWEVINASVPGYNVVQYRAMWQKKWREIKPDILLLRVGGNEISQSYALGSTWRPGLSWPWEFILKLEKKSSRLEKILHRSCLYCSLGRNKITKRPKFKRVDDNFQWDRTLTSIFDNQKAILEDARSLGTKVAFVSLNPAYSPSMTRYEAKTMELLQNNWREFYDGWAGYQFEYIQRLRDELALQLDAPFVNLAQEVWKNPKRAKFYVDVVHFSAQGHDYFARTLFDQVERLGWWQEKKVMKQ